ncbi:hypothetical protein EJB05_25420, partial [Eragrostis curvula]
MEKYYMLTCTYVVLTKCIRSKFLASRYLPAAPIREKMSKSSWPELLGVLATLAANQIGRDRPDVAVEVLPPGAPLTPDYNPLRVRVFMDNNAVVIQIPVIG